MAECTVTKVADGCRHNLSLKNATDGQTDGRARKANVTGPRTYSAQFQNAVVDTFIFATTSATALSTTRIHMQFLIRIYLLVWVLGLER
jgi:hypothetical protein